MRQQRGTRYPDPVVAAALCELAGADGITVHLREDRRHIQDRDVRVLRETVRGVLNLEMAATDEMLAHRARGEARLLHAGSREARGADDGGRADASRRAARWRRSCAGWPTPASAVSLFIDPEPRVVEASRAHGRRHRRAAHGRLLPGAARAGAESARQLQRLELAARAAGDAGLRLGAGHGLDYANVGPVAALAGLEELNIGHGLVARAVMIGMQRRRRRAACRDRGGGGACVTFRRC